MLVLSADDVRQALPMADAIGAMRDAFLALAEGRADVPERIHLPVEAHDGVNLVMPAYLQDDAEALALKVVSLYGGNAARGLPRIHAAVLALEPETGRPVALIEGTTLTALRTGAASGLATDLLARPESRTAAIFGAGPQARTQLEAVCTVRRIERAWVHDPDRSKAEEFVRAMAGKAPVPLDLRAAENPGKALAEADIVCTATTAGQPVFADADLKPGTHINAIGSYQPQVQEIPPETVRRARVVVDSREAALAETGDLIQPIEQGLIDPEHIHAELGELVLGSTPTRSDDEEITLFKSVGVAVQDAAAARAALARAAQLGLGQEVRW
jgi:ornithine cyclodeaminase